LITDCTMTRIKRQTCLFLFVLLLTSFEIKLYAQSRERNRSIPVYVDKSGIMRWTSNNKEASFFGVNYTVPFAYGFRSHKVLGVDLETAIRQDVYHMARLGFNAFRVHVWDTEITDSTGNLLENEHLRLFDFLLAELKKRNIKTLVTPIAYWGSGYPEPDVKTAGFSSIYNKQQSVTKDRAIAAQENYLKQFFKHVNPYTKTTYGNDPDVITMEIYNEPHHSGPKEKTTDYINRMTAAVRSTGWIKPVFYNISESPSYADAIANANVDGHSFQWYPTGLVANYTLQGNFLPNVDRYFIPFIDTVPAFRNRARMVYEFDAGDVLGSYMYPAMTRSFRAAGFQWATQFAYDPLATAYANTEYQTHYVNLAYTPSKAISLMIAGEAFRNLPLFKNYGTYPADTVFDVFRVSYRESLSEMNADDKFYYSNNTNTQPKNQKKLQHIAGVGNSPLILYEGTGAYFLDKIKEGIWRLEVMPDAVHIRDPFEKASPEKEVTRIQWQEHPMRIMLPGLGNSFHIKDLQATNAAVKTANDQSFSVNPGTYILAGKKENVEVREDKLGVIGMNEFVAPKPVQTDPYLYHIPFEEVSSGSQFVIKAKVVGIDTSTKVTLFINKYYGEYRTIPMKRTSVYDYEGEVPAALVTSGLLNYRIVIQKDTAYTVFPGNHKGNPFAWDNYINDTWQTIVVSPAAKLELFNAAYDKKIKTYPPFRRNFKTEYITDDQTGDLVLRLSATSLANEPLLGFVHFIGDQIKGRASGLPAFNQLVVRARTNAAEPVIAKIKLVTKDAYPFAASITLTNSFQDIGIPLDNFKADSLLLMPRPYPGFQPMWLQPAFSSSLELQDVGKLEISIGSELSPAQKEKPYSIEIQSVWLKKNN
jgi:hypothetical protein